MSTEKIEELPIRGVPTNEPRHDVIHQDVICLQCEKVEEIELPMRGERIIPPCSCGGERQVTFIKPRPFNIAEQTGIIWSEKQVESSHGKDWRETPGSKRGPGGVGEKQYFHKGAGGAW